MARRTEAELEGAMREAEAARGQGGRGGTGEADESSVGRAASAKLRKEEQAHRACRVEAEKSRTALALVRTQSQVGPTRSHSSPGPPR